MKHSLFSLVAFALLAAPAMADDIDTAAIEQTSAPTEAANAAPVRVREGQTVYAADGERLGLVDRVSERGTVLVRGGSARFLSLPLSSLSRTDGRLVSTFTRQQVLAQN